MITPPLEPGKRYPVFFEHYGGPHSQTVSKGWGGALEQALVDKGYIYFEIDNRGSANRGVEFEKPIYRAMGSVEVAGPEGRRRLFLKSLPFVDPKRIAIYGWSYGGYMTLKMLEADPGPLRRRHRRRAGDQVGAVRHLLHRALHGRRRRRTRRPTPSPTRSPMPARSAIRCWSSTA